MCREKIKGKSQGRKKLECFIYGDEHYAMSCLYQKKIANASLEHHGEDDKDEQQVNVTI
jgi:hypothetical protein